MTVRTPISQFELANPLYKNASIAFYTVANGAVTSTLAALYSGASGVAQLSNPQKLNSKGQFKQPVYVQVQVIGVITGISVPSHNTGIISPAPSFQVTSDPSPELEYSYDGGVTWNNAGAIVAAGVASLITFIQAGTGAVTRWLQDKVRESVSVFDFMDAATIANIKLMTAAGLAAQDSTVVQAAIQAAIESTFNSSTGEYAGSIYLPKGGYAVAGRIQIGVQGSARGLKFYGDGPQATIIYNYNTVGQYTVEFGQGGGDYDITARDFSVESMTGLNWGIKINSVRNSVFENIRAGIANGFQGHGFYMTASWQNTFSALRARRCGNYGGGSTGTVAGGVFPYGAAGFYVDGNVGHNFINCSAEECDVGLIGYATGVELHKFDTECNVHGGLKLYGGGSITCHNGYQEQQTIGAGVQSDDNWYIGDGTNPCTYAAFMEHSFGNNSRIVFNKCTHYYFANPYMSYPYNCIEIVDPGTTKGHMDSGYSPYLEQLSNGYAYFGQHESEASHTGNLLPNGSFEAGQAVETGGGIPGWVVLSGGGAPPSTGTVAIYADSSGADFGSRCLKLVRTGGSSGAQLGVSSNITRATTPIVLKAGRVYTLEFSYKCTVDDALFLAITTGGTNYAFGPSAGMSFPAAASWKRYRTMFTAKGSGSLGKCDIYLSENATAYIDSMCLYEGIENQGASFNIDDAGLETYHLQDVLAESDTVIHSSVGAAAYAAGAAPDLQPDVPRCVKYVTDAAWTNANVQIAGYDGRGRYQVEDKNLGPGLNPSTYGTIAFSRINTITTPNQAGSLSIGVGSLIGLPKSAAAIIKIKQNTTDVTAKEFDLTNGTVDLTTITGGDDFTIWYLH